MILVSIPALFADARAHSCRLVAAETHGLWLVSDELSQLVLVQGRRKKDAVAPAILVPFAQIAAIVPVVQAPVATIGLKPATAATTTTKPPAPAASTPTKPAAT
jgi:hypothetical protein